MITRSVVLVIVACALSACASADKHHRDKFRASALPYSIGKVRFDIRTGPESRAALNLAKRLIQRNVDACHKFEQSGLPRSDVTVEVFSYNFQRVYGVFVPGRSRLSAYARWDAKGSDSYRFKVRGMDHFQNDLLSVPAGSGKQFFSKKVVDSRLAHAFAGSFMRRIGQRCSETPRYRAWAESVRKNPSHQISGNTSNLRTTTVEPRRAKRQDASIQPTSNAQPRRPRQGSVAPTPPPVPGS